MNIIPFTQPLLPALRAHFERHWAESGGDGVHFLPFDLTQPARPKGIDPTACTLPVGTHGWQRWFVVFEGDQLLGHAGLKGDPMHAGSHRCELGMGIEMPLRGKGVGHQLLTHVISYATGQDNLEWMDLRVMADNKRARQLYERCGFTQTGFTRDRFRIQDKSLDEVTMTRALQSNGRN